MKKVISLTVVLIMVIAMLIPIMGFANQEVKIKVNGQEFLFSSPPIIENNRTMVYVQDLFNTIGGFQWSEHKDLIVIASEEIKISFPYNKKIAHIDFKEDGKVTSETVDIDVTAKIVDGKAYIPFRLIAEGLGWNVGWEQKTSTVLVNKPSDKNIITEIEYEIISQSDIKENSMLNSWYQENFRTKGVHHKIDGEYVYILVAGGERPTGGYSANISLITLLGQETVFVYGTIEAPGEDMMVTQAITYPNKLIRIARNNINKVKGEITDVVKATDLLEMGKEIKIEDIKSIELLNMMEEKIKEYDEFERLQIINNLNNSKIDDSMYIMVIVGNTMAINLKDDSSIRITSYGSDTNIIASGELDGEPYMYHLICPEIAKMLLE